MVLEPREQEAEPQPQRRVVRSQPTRYIRSWGPGAPERGTVLPEVEPGSPAFQPKACHQESSRKYQWGREKVL